MSSAGLVRLRRATAEASIRSYVAESSKAGPSRLSFSSAPARSVPPKPLRSPPRSRKNAQKNVPTRPRFADTPSELAIRIKDLSSKPGGIDVAVELVQRSSAKVAGTSAWTQLVDELAKHGRQRPIRDAFLEMKRRRVPFDSQFYVVFFNALARSPHVEYPILRNRWTDWNKLRRTLAEDRRHLQVSNAFIRALVRHKHFEAAVDAFETMPADGQLAPDSFTVLEILPALRHAGKEKHYRRVRDIWQARDDPDVVDPKASLKFAAAFLQSQDPQHVALAKSILLEHLGVRLDDDPPLTGGRALLDAGSFSSLLKMLADLGRRDVAARIFLQVVGNSQAYLEPDAMDLGHCATGILFLAEEAQVEKVMDVLRWMVKIRRPKLVPVSDTLEKALQAAFRTESSSAAFLILLSLTRRFDLLTPEEADHPLVAACRSRSDLGPVRLTSRGACTLLQTVREAPLEAGARAMTLLDALDARLPLSIEELRHLVEAERRTSPSPLRPFSAPQERQWRDRLLFAQHATLSRLIQSRHRGPWNAWRDELAEELEGATERKEKEQAVARVVARG